MADDSWPSPAPWARATSCALRMALVNQPNAMGRTLGETSDERASVPGCAEGVQSVRENSNGLGRARSSCLIIREGAGGVGCLHRPIVPRMSLE